MEERQWPQRVVSFASAFFAGGLLYGWFKLLDVWGGRTLLTQGVSLSVIFGGFIFAYLLSLLLRRFKLGFWACALLLTLSAGWAALMIARAPDVHHNWLVASIGLSRTYAGFLKLLWATAVALMLPVAVLHGLCVALLARKYPLSTVKIFAVMGFCIGALLFPRFIGGPLLFESLMAALIALAFLFVAGMGAMLTRPRVLKIIWLFPLAAALWFMPWRAANPPLLAKGVMGMVANRDFAFSGTADIAVYWERLSDVRTIFADEDYGNIYTIDGRPVMADTRFRTAPVAAAALPFFLKPNGTLFALSGPEYWIYEQPMRRFAAACPGARLFVENRDTKKKSKGDASWTEVAALERKPHDALFIAPEPNWLRGARAYTTSGYYKECGRFLAPDGILFVHLDVRSMNVEMIARRILALKETYSEIQIWVVGNNDWVLAASRAPIEVPLSAMLARFDAPGMLEALLTGGIRSIPELLAAHLCGPADVDRMLAAITAPISRTPPYTESYTAQRLLFDEQQGLRLLPPFEDFRTTSLDWLKPASLDPVIANEIIAESERLVGARAWVTLASALLATKQTNEALKFASRIREVTPRDMLILEWADRIELDARRFFALAEYKRALAAYESIFAISQGTAEQSYGAALAAQALTQKTKALTYFRIATELAPSVDRYIFALAQAQTECETFGDAVRNYDFLIEHALTEADRLQARFLKAQVLAKKENPHRDPAAAVEQATALCDETQWENDTFTYGLADILMDAGRVMEGVSLKRKLREERGSGSARLPESTLRRP